MHNRHPECIMPARAPPWSSVLVRCVCISAGMNEAITGLHWRQYHCVRTSHFPTLSVIRIKPCPGSTAGSHEKFVP